MHSTTIVSFLFATAAIAAPILSGTTLPVSTSDLDLSSVTEEVEGVVGELPVRRGLLSGLTSSVPLDTSSLPVSTSSLPLDTSDLPVDTSTVTSAVPTDLDTSEVTGLVLEVTSATSELSGATSEVTDATSALPNATVPAVPKRLLSGLTSVLTTVNDLLVDVLSLVSEIETDLSSLVANLENVDLEGVLGDVYTIGNQVVAKLHSILAAEDADVDLSSLQPLLNTLNGELNSVVAEVQQLIDAGIVGELIDEVKSVLQDVLTLVKEISGEDSLKA